MENPYLDTAMIAVASGVWATVFAVVGLQVWRRTQGAHWTRQAAALVTVRRNAAAAVLLIPVCTVLVARRLEPEAPIPWVLAWCGGLVLVMAAQAVVLSPVRQAQTFREWAGSALLTLGGYWRAWVLALLGLWLAPPDGFWAVGWTAGGIVLMASGALDLALIAVLRLGGWLKSGDERLRRIVGTAGDQCGLRAGHIGILRCGFCDVLAVQTGRWIVFTERAAAGLSDGELQALAAQRLAGLEETIGAGFLRHCAASAPLLLLPARWDAADDGTGAYVVTGVILAASMAIYPRLLRKREEAADTAARRHEEHPRMLGVALEKVYRTNLKAAVLGPGRSSPELYDRMLASGYRPDFDRPAPPPHPLLAYVLVLIGAGLVVFG